MNRENMMADIQKDWDENPHWENIKRTCSVGDAVCVNGLVHRAYANVRLGLEKLWNLLKEGSKTKRSCQAVFDYHYFDFSRSDRWL